MEKIKLQEAEIKKLKELTETARTTPVIALSTKDALSGKDWSTLAWNEVRDYWKELGKKYGFNPEDVQIDLNTREIKKRKIVKDEG